MKIMAFKAEATVISTVNETPRGGEVSMGETWVGFTQYRKNTVHMKVCAWYYLRFITELMFASVLGSRHDYFQRWEWEARTDCFLESSSYPALEGLTMQRCARTCVCVCVFMGL